ncbi:prolipoprotein diacylglyceryl transferase [Patescibacteria group bacterium]|nr:prolipoprotein diacylglyceryl transferase [Patescibacteria group bacterium]
MIPYFSYNSITFGPITIQIWGLFVAVGVLLALYLSLKDAKKKNINQDYIWDIFVIMLIGMILGSKSADILFNYNTIKGVEDIIYIYSSGFSFLGGVLLSYIFLYIYAKSKKINIYKILDNLILGAIIALIITRIGCFLVYDHIGKITNLPWGRIYLDGSIRHPVALYHLIGGIVIIVIICYLRKVNLKEGILTLLVILVYIVIRFFSDFVRCTDLYLCDSRYYNLTHSQWLLLLILPFVILKLVKKNKLSKINNN